MTVPDEEPGCLGPSNRIAGGDNSWPLSMANHPIGSERLSVLWPDVNETDHYSWASCSGKAVQNSLWKRNKGLQPDGRKPLFSVSPRGESRTPTLLPAQDPKSCAWLDRNTVPDGISGNQPKPCFNGCCNANERNGLWNISDCSAFRPASGPLSRHDRDGCCEVFPPRRPAVPAVPAVFCFFSCWRKTGSQPVWQPTRSAAQSCLSCAFCGPTIFRTMITLTKPFRLRWYGEEETEIPSKEVSSRTGWTPWTAG